MGPDSNEHSCVAALVKTSFIASTTFFLLHRCCILCIQPQEYTVFKPNSLACLHYILTILRVRYNQLLLIFKCRRNILLIITLL